MRSKYSGPASTSGTHGSPGMSSTPGIPGAPGTLRAFHILPAFARRQGLALALAAAAFALLLAPRPATAGDYGYSHGDRPSMVVAAVQSQLRFFPSSAAFRSFVLGRVALAMTHQPDLIVFPEDIGLTLVSLGDCQSLCAEANTVPEAARVLIKHHADQVREICRRYRVSPMRALWLLKAPRIRRAYQTAFMIAALRYKTWIVAGSVPMVFPQNRARVYNVCCVFSPDGKMHVVAAKVHPIKLEQAGGLDFCAAPAASYHAIKTPKATIGCLVCADAWDPALSERLIDQGADVLVQVSANPKLWTAEEARNWKKGLFARVQQLGVYGVSCMGVGNVLDIPFRGQTQVLAPLGWTRRGDGILAMAPSSSAEDVVVARLDLRPIIADSDHNNGSQ